MKKILFLISASILLISCSCGGGSSSNSNTSSISYEVSGERPDPYKETYNKEKKYNGNYTDIYTSEVYMNNMHYTFIARKGGNVFVVNTTIDSLKRKELELNIEKMDF